MVAVPIKHIKGLIEQSPSDRIQTVRSGAISTSIIPELSQAIASDASSVWRLLGVSERTASRRMAKQENLKTNEADRLIRLVEALELAEDLFGDPVKARRWLNKPNRALGGVVPLSLLDTHSGFELVRQALGRLAYGVYV